jgi:hypothetical protein
MHDDDLRFLDGVHGLRSTGLIGRQGYGLGDFRHDGQTDGGYADGRKSAGQDISKHRTAIECCHFFLPGLHRCRALRSMKHQMRLPTGLSIRVFP